MGDLYLNVFEIKVTSVKAPVESAMCLTALHYLGYPTSINIHFITDEVNEGTVEIKFKSVDYNVLDRSCIPFPASQCQLPVFAHFDNISCVAGLCAVLRQIVKISGNEWHTLLGFREACLVACAEFSMWTKFCEIDLIQCSKNVLKGCGKESSVLPVELARLETHLSQPIRIHNIGKLKVTDHTYVEGPNFLLSDIVIAISVYIIYQTLQCWDSLVLPLTSKWLNTVKTVCGLNESLELLELSTVVREPRDYSLPLVSNHSLYKSDPKRYKPRDKLFTQQCDIDKSMDKLISVPLKEYEDPLCSNAKLTVDNIPVPDVPQERLERKVQQLSNLSKAVLQVAQPNDVIVDFCCGSGHLGFILAHCLPACAVVLLDNKERSLNRAKDKLQSLNLKNVYIIQANLDYYIGHFQLITLLTECPHFATEFYNRNITFYLVPSYIGGIRLDWSPSARELSKLGLNGSYQIVGVSLHACGVASDLVIQKCLQKGANFVVCPCCYGSIQSNHILSYPQSLEFLNAGLTEKDYLVLGHCADQAGTEQGDKGMQIVDTDRCLVAQRYGYSVSLSKLIPPVCTPRNNLIIAKSPKRLNKS